MKTTSYVSFRVSKNGNPYAEFSTFTEQEGDVYLRTEDVDKILALRPINAENYSRNLFPRKDGSYADVTTTRFRVDLEFVRSAGGFASITSAAVHVAPKSTAFAALGELAAKQATAKAPAVSVASVDSTGADADLG